MSYTEIQKAELAQATAQILRNAYPESLPPMPTTLWHYTSNAKLQKILESRSLWATHVSCVNDTKEVQHLFDLIFKRLKRYPLTCGTRPIISVLNSFGDKDHCATSDWFISSFCTDGDDLNLWRAYTDPNGGVAIGFNSKNLLRLAWNSDRAVLPPSTLPETYLLPVIYDYATKTRLVSNLMRKIRKLCIRHSGNEINVASSNYWAAVEEQIAVVAPLIKHTAFKSENEWRLMVKFGCRSIDSLAFSTRSTTITRHLPLRLEADDQNDGTLISEVKIGPGQHQAIMKAGIEALLNSKGYTQVDVTPSSIPFRSL
jgi:hypothetical protein